MRARGSGVIVNITSDAAVQAYPTWGGYGASKAALEHLSRVLAAELDGSGIRVYTVDPGDMNTQMHQEAEPGEDLSHLPGPEVSAPAIVRLIEQATVPFGRFEAQLPAASLSSPWKMMTMLATAHPHKHPYSRRRRAAESCSPVSACSLRATPDLEAHEPPEARGLQRDQVRLLVSHYQDDRIAHARFDDLPSFLRARRPAGGERLGDAAGRADRPPGGRQHASRCTSRPGCPAASGWSSRARRQSRRPRRWPCPAAAPRRCWRRTPTRLGCGWPASICPLPVLTYLREWGRPIAYPYVPRALAAHDVPDRLRATSLARPRCPRPGGPSAPTCWPGWLSAASASRR